MTFQEEYAIGQFGKKIVNQLKKKGITFIGVQMIPNRETGEWANADVAYCFSDNGNGICRSYFQVKELAKQ